MKQTITILMTMSLLGLAACADSQKEAKVHYQTKVQSLAWEEIVAADTTAHVANNNLIMMR